jgi:hypothetical protein
MQRPESIAMNVLTPAVEIRESAKTPICLLILNGWQRVPAVRTRSIAGAALGQQVVVPDPHGTPGLGEARASEQ